ncbi:MAG: helix-turn-helix transcriptional regulator [Clostridia bacterium]|nr:helix-turn-helix transcriptional regulator [Clostridia bacterium]
MSEKSIKLTDDYYFQQASKIQGNKSSSHYHSLIEIYYMKRGKCNYFIDDKSYKVEAGDLVFIPSGIIHKTTYDTEFHDRWLINCSEFFIPESVLSEIKTLPHVFRRSQVTAECERVMQKIDFEYKKSDEYSVDALKGLTYELIFLLVRNAKTQAENPSGSAFIERAVKYIQENYHGEITLSGVAETFAVSPEHLSRTFKKETGFCFSEYLTLFRLQKAEYMLKNEPGRSVNGVAFACGFNDSNYFSYKFKKTYGVSPKKILQKHKK